jgi:hypothetical protein
MIFNYEMLKAHNLKFFDAMVDLKVEGWNSYANALNSFTNSFFSKQVGEMTEVVKTTGENMKKTVAKGTI